MNLKLASSPHELRTCLAGRAFVLVPTMGALHEGHIWLVDMARRCNLPVVVSIFVNPLQFDDSLDLDTYPRTLEQDLEKLEGKAFAVYSPSVETMYPNGLDSIRIDPGPIGRILEGAIRPGFFDGILTIVAKLLLQTAPERVFFSKKDAQQAFLVRRMVRELAFPVRVEVTGFLRDKFSLPYSSRNRKLGVDAREKAQRLSQGLLSVVNNGPLTVRDCIDKITDLANSIGVDLGYAQILDENFCEIASDRMVTRAFHSEACIGLNTPLFLLAARVHGVRVVDNFYLVVV